MIEFKMNLKRQEFKEKKKKEKEFSFRKGTQCDDRIEKLE